MEDSKRGILKIIFHISFFLKLYSPLISMNRRGIEEDEMNRLTKQERVNFEVIQMGLNCVNQVHFYFKEQTVDITNQKRDFKSQSNYCIMNTFSKIK